MHLLQFGLQVVVLLDYRVYHRLAQLGRLHTENTLLLLQLRRIIPLQLSLEVINCILDHIHNSQLHTLLRILRAHRLFRLL
jgi:hypothetical protein